MGDRLRTRRPSFRSPNRRTYSPFAGIWRRMPREQHSRDAMQHSTLTSGSQLWRGQPCLPSRSSTKMWYNSGKPKRNHRGIWVGTRPVTVAVYNTATKAYRHRHSTIWITDGKVNAFTAKNTQPIQTATAVRYNRSRPDSRTVSANTAFAAMGRKIWSQSVGREIASSPQAQTMRTTAEQTISSADRTAGKLRPGSR